MDETLTYYRTQGRLSGLGKYTQEAQQLSSAPDKLSMVVQQIILHDMWIDRYKVRPKRAQWCPALTPSMEDLIDTLVGVNQDRPFASREAGERVIACCREFSVMLCSLLRAKGIPARARCGFAPYLAREGFYEDHWMCEAWNGTFWKRIDPQIDSLQLKAFHDYAQHHAELGKEYRTMLLEFNPQDLKPSDFMIAGEAWIGSREGKLDTNRLGLGVDPKKYGLTSSYGLWFIRGNLVRDFLALNKLELVPFIEGLEKSKDYWNDWPIMRPDHVVNKEEYELLDKMARLSLEPDEKLKDIQGLFAQHAELHPPVSILL